MPLAAASSNMVLTLIYVVYILKLDMHNAFNDGATYVFPAEFWFGKICILSYASVQQVTLWDRFVSLVLVDFFDQIPSIP